MPASAEARLRLPADGPRMSALRPPPRGRRDVRPQEEGSPARDALRREPLPDRHQGRTGARREALSAPCRSSTRRAIRGSVRGRPQRGAHRIDGRHARAGRPGRCGRSVRARPLPRPGAARETGESISPAGRQRGRGSLRRPGTRPRRLVVADREARAMPQRRSTTRTDAFSARSRPRRSGARRGAPVPALSADVDRLARKTVRSKVARVTTSRRDSAEMRRVKDVIARGGVRVNVLVTARAHRKRTRRKLLHSGSSRREGPFLALNCAAVPESLLEASSSASRRACNGRGGAHRKVRAGERRHDLPGRDRRRAAPDPGQAPRVFRSGRSSGSADGIACRSTSGSSRPPMRPSIEIRAGRFRRTSSTGCASWRSGSRRFATGARTYRLAATFLSRIAARTDVGLCPVARRRQGAPRLSVPGKRARAREPPRGAAALVSGSAIEAADLQFGAMRNEAPTFSSRTSARSSRRTSAASSPPSKETKARREDPRVSEGLSIGSGLSGTSCLFSH